MAQNLKQLWFLLSPSWCASSIHSPKRGKGRAVLKRPPYQKNQAWKKVAYTRGKLGKEIRADRHSWTRSLPELLSASESSLIRKLREDKLLPPLEKHLCPRCEKGTLSKLRPHPGTGALKHRCNHCSCQAYTSPTICLSHAAIHRLLQVTKP